MQANKNKSRCGQLKRCVKLTHPTAMAIALSAAIAINRKYLKWLDNLYKKTGDRKGHAKVGDRR
jgi:hypothetical protein